MDPAIDDEEARERERRRRIRRKKKKLKAKREAAARAAAEAESGGTVGTTGTLHKGLSLAPLKPLGSTMETPKNHNGKNIHTASAPTLHPIVRRIKSPQIKADQKYPSLERIKVNLDSAADKKTFNNPPKPTSPMFPWSPNAQNQGSSRVNVVQQAREDVQRAERVPKVPAARTNAGASTEQRVNPNPVSTETAEEAAARRRRRRIQALKNKSTGKESEITGAPGPNTTKGNRMRKVVNSTQEAADRQRQSQIARKIVRQHSQTHEELEVLKDASERLLAKGEKWQKVLEVIFRHARQCQNKQIMTMFDRGVPVDIRDQFKNTILIVAGSQNNKHLLKKCLRRGADINAQNKNGNTAAHQCFRFKYNDLGFYLVEKGADIHLKNDEGQSVFSMIKELGKQQQ